MFLKRFNKYALTRIFNYRFVCLMMGRLCLLQVPFLLLSVLVSLYYQDAGLKPLLQCIGAMIGVGLLLCLAGRSSNLYNAGRREGMMSVTLSWIIVSLVGMLPYKIGGYVPGWSDAFFETISGFTTTGATIFSEVENLPRSILLWRSITQWEGGIGIVVFAVALLPIMGGSASHLLVSETSGVTHERFTPRSGVMAKWLIGIYLMLSATCLLLFCLGPMGWFDALCHAMSCISTGGFSTRNDSLAAYANSPYTQAVATLFMIIGAVNFTLLYHSLRNQHSKLWRDTEFRWFIGAIVVLTLVSGVGLFIKGVYPSFAQSCWMVLPQLVSLITSTGLVSVDYDLWPPFFGFIAIFAMFVTGCAGSTSGGLKMGRFVILIKNLGNEFQKRTHPNAVLPVRINGRPIPGKVVHQVLAFFFAYLSLGFLAATVIAFEGFTLRDSLASAIACLSNAGPGMGPLGPTEPFAVLSPFSKLMLSFIMVLGRLEIFTVLTLFHPSFWKH